MTSRSRGHTSPNRPLDNCGLGVSCIGVWLLSPSWCRRADLHILRLACNSVEHLDKLVASLIGIVKKTSFKALATAKR
jgi:hypothetical protein